MPMTSQMMQVFAAFQGIIAVLIKLPKKLFYNDYVQEAWPGILTQQDRL